ncbi:HIT family protein [Agrobacterium sp. LAD9]|uniref:HIT family protein n=1 Tax=Agrobacterium sp. LAD9 TaxID=2055153 RepID=UPI000D1E0A08|nr:HIT family protein [Agrobacterium sp. LAD9]
MTQDIPPHLHIARNAHWSINHRVNSALPGYLIIASTKATNDLSDLSVEALSSMGRVFAVVQRALKSLGATRIYIGRYGHSLGYPIHFHAIPIYEWVEDLFWADHRYRVLQQLSNGPEDTQTDGAELSLFVWREFCERPDPPLIRGPSVAEAIATLRQTIQFS